MHKLDIRGSLVAIVTPMTSSGDIDHEAFDRLIDWHVEAGTAAIVVVGTTGESATLSPDEHRRLVEHCVEAAEERIPVVAGTGSNNTEEALMFTESARECGAAAALLVTPYYTRPSQEGLYAHYARIADRVDIPQILYNVPGRTACDLQLETVARLAEHDNIAGIKDATGSKARGLELIKELGSRLRIYSGEDGLSRELMLAGADGTISVTANVAPELMAKMCAAALAGDDKLAAELDARLEGLHSSLFLEANPIPVKWALAQMGRIQAGIRLPLTELNARYQLQVTEALQQAGIG
jgi:4-hydroxy-tetrahydrodipicolinate synthase